MSPAGELPCSTAPIRSGAAFGAFLTDFVLIPQTGIFTTQLAAVAVNLVAGGGAFAVARTLASPGLENEARPALKTATLARLQNKSRPALGPVLAGGSRPVRWVVLALAMSGFAALGMEMLWLRHLALLLGGFRAVFSLLLTVMLLALGAGALLGGWLDRRFGRPAQTLILVEALFAATALLGLASGNAATLAERSSALAASLGNRPHPAR
jgi:spermidine synthase